MKHKKLKWVRCSDELPPYPNRLFLTRWSDGEYETINAVEYPNFFTGSGVQNAFMTHWAEIEGPDDE